MRKRGETGFTLIEIAVAIALLGSALSVIITLQSRLIDTMMQERNLFRASLLAQYVLTFLDVDQYPPEPGTDKGKLEDLLEKRGYFDGEMPDNQKQSLQSWSYTMEVQSIDVGPFQDVLRRINLTISWGLGSGEETSFLYYMVSDPFGERPQQSLGGSGSGSGTGVGGP